MFTIKVINAKAITGPATEGTQRFYVGRYTSYQLRYGHNLSVLGNPFTKGSREHQVEAYRQRMRELYRTKPNGQEWQAIRRLYVAAKKGNIELVCWCAPLQCHADAIKDFLELSITEAELTKRNDEAAIQVDYDLDAHLSEEDIANA